MQLSFASQVQGDLARGLELRETPYLPNNHSKGSFIFSHYFWFLHEKYLFRAVQKEFLVLVVGLRGDGKLFGAEQVEISETLHHGLGLVDSLLVG